MLYVLNYIALFINTVRCVSRIGLQKVSFPRSGIMSVQLEAPVVFKITGHLNQMYPAAAGGILLGTGPEEQEQEDIRRVTESFALPRHVVESGGANFASKEASKYTQAMISKLGFVGADQHIEGWYLSSSVGAIYDSQVFENLFSFQKKNPMSFLLVHDVAFSRATHTMGLRAFRLSEKFLKVRSAGSSKISTDMLVENQLTFKSLLEELDVEIANPILVNIYLANYVNNHPETTQVSGSLNVPEQSLIETRGDSAMETVDDLNYEQGNYNYYQRQLVREKQRVLTWQQKRKSENAQRAEFGKEPLPTDEWKTLFSLPEEPSRLENLLLSAQLDEHCAELEELAGSTSATLLATKFT